MRAMILSNIDKLEHVGAPLTLVNLPVPKPGRGQVLVRVAACGVCHTELDEIEGRTPPPQFPIVPGHEVVGQIVKLGDGVTQHSIGDRVGVDWIYSSSGDAQENISSQFLATGRDVHGGYAEYIVAEQDYAYPIPEIFSDAAAAPLFCAGAIGYRALRLTQIENGDLLGLTGFGGSAHLVLQMVRHKLPDSKVFVFARDPVVRRCECNQARANRQCLSAVAVEIFRALEASGIVKPAK